jgi:hypothetical protein
VADEEPRKTESSATKEFNPEERAPLIKRIADGDDYVLF